MWKLDRAISPARRRAARALVRAAEAMVQGSPNLVEEVTTKLVASASEKRQLLATLTESKASSLSADVRDYAVAARWARPLVILRGLAGRAVLRDQIRRARRELKASYEMLAAHAFDNDVQALQKCVPAELAEEVVETRAEIDRAVRERLELVAPFGGTALPRACHWVAREIVLFFAITGGELKNRFLPRAPALVGLIIGWWIPRAFTASRSPGILRLLGFGRAGKHYLPPGTFRAVSFWLPLLASVLCAYLATRLGAFVRHRYSAPTPPDLARPTKVHRA